MTDIEELLRESFAAQVADQPPLHAPADRAIRAGRAARRRRTLFGPLASAVAVLVASVGVAATPASAPDRPQLPPPVPGPFAVDEVVDGVLRLGDGATVDLRTTNTYEVFRTRDGWLALDLVTELDRGGLWLVTPDHKLHNLISGTSGMVAVGVDGRHFAWRVGNQLRTGHLTGTSVQIDHTTPTSDAVYPTAVSDTAVVLTYRPTGTYVDHTDVWLPASGPYTPSWDDTPDVIVYGPAPDGRDFLGLTGTTSGNPGDLCLALLDPVRHLVASRTACGMSIGPDPWAVLSPDHRWLVVPTFDRNNALHLGLVDLTTVFDRPGYTAVWDADNALGWIGPDTLLAMRRTNDRLVFQLGRSGSVPFTMAGVPSDAHVEPVTVLVS